MSRKVGILGLCIVIIGGASFATYHWYRENHTPDPEAIKIISENLAGMDLKQAKEAIKEQASNADQLIEIQNIADAMSAQQKVKDYSTKQEKLSKSPFHMLSPEEFNKNIHYYIQHLKVTQSKMDSQTTISIDYSGNTPPIIYKKPSITIEKMTYSNGEEDTKPFKYRSPTEIGNNNSITSATLKIQYRYLTDGQKYELKKGESHLEIPNGKIKVDEWKYNHVALTAYGKATDIVKFEALNSDYEVLKESSSEYGNTKEYSKALKDFLNKLKDISKSLDQYKTKEKLVHDLALALSGSMALMDDNRPIKISYYAFGDISRVQFYIPKKFHSETITKTFNVESN